MNPTNALFDGSAVHIFSIRDFVNGYFAELVIDVVDDPEIALTHAITIRVTRELFRAPGTGVRCQRRDFGNNPLTSGL